MFSQLFFFSYEMMMMSPNHLKPSFGTSVDYLEMNQNNPFHVIIYLLDFYRGRKVWLRDQHEMMISDWYIRIPYNSLNTKYLQAIVHSNFHSRFPSWSEQTRLALYTTRFNIKVYENVCLWNVSFWLRIKTSNSKVSILFPRA